jgi:hypothetical protein
VLAVHRENDSTLTAPCKRGDDCRNLTPGMSCLPKWRRFGRSAPCLC